MDLSSEEDTPTEHVTTDQAPLQPSPEQTTVRRSGRERRIPDYYGVRVNLSQTVPSTVDVALSTPERGCWHDAMEQEMKSLHDNDVWELVKLPENRKPVGSKWVFKAKTDADGHVERHKA